MRGRAFIPDPRALAMLAPAVKVNIEVAVESNDLVYIGTMTLPMWPTVNCTLISRPSANYWCSFSV